MATADPLLRRAAALAVACLALVTRPSAAVLVLRQQPKVSVLATRTSPGSYPNYRDAACRSHGEFVCDPGPTTVLADEELAGLAAELQKLRRSSENLVTCGSLVNDPVDKRHLQPFYLGVAFATEWPATDSTPESLQQFGQIVAADWNMDELYVGSPQPYLRCPNTAMLIILPDQKQAMLSSASCEFICAARGGSQVVQRTLEALHSAGAYSAALAGIHEAYSFLAQNGASSEVTVISQAAADMNRTRDGYRWVQPFYSTLALRIYFAIALAFLIGSVALGVMVLLLGPGLISRHAK
mmetsp:Transcript_45477/g.117626  ORF Transcript_45477/g.117626 Transcript_45477/m.117626 type:complete len:297 (+) Transcript_45477:150-1040(+)